jgi:ubiquinol-cytochrome c reductase cytochrome b subunit
MRCHNKIQLLGVMNDHLVAYPTPMNLNWSWNGGSLAGIMLGGQMLTGILLAMHYVAHVDYAFASVQHLMTDVPSGMILRYSHANGASLFFVVVYLHLLRGLYYNSGSQPREVVWITGIVIMLVMIITAFIGYVLPWGQMSFWGATVITSLATAIPVVGKSIMYWLWGGFSVDNPTLNRFYSLHYTLPFVLAGLSVFHIVALHQYGSTNPLSVNSQSSTIAFGTYFGVKDLLGALFLWFIMAYLVFFNPDLLGHSDNLIPANPYVTPTHIVPEWYVLFVYAVLRSIPDKAMGVLAVGLVFASLIAQPFINLGGGRFRIITEWLFWVFVADMFLLTWLGACEITPTTTFVGQMCTIYMFAHLLFFTPVVSWFETHSTGLSMSRFAADADLVADANCGTTTAAITTATNTGDNPSKEVKDYTTHSAATTASTTAAADAAAAKAEKAANAAALAACLLTTADAIAANVELGANGKVKKPSSPLRASMMMLLDRVGN